MRRVESFLGFGYIVLSHKQEIPERTAALLIVVPLLFWSLNMCYLLL